MYKRQAVLERQASRDNISNGRIFYGYSRGLAVRERQNIGDLVADLGRGLVRRLLNAGAAVTDVIPAGLTFEYGSVMLDGSGTRDVYKRQVYCFSGVRLHVLIRARILAAVALLKGLD